jgi:hypothetical protein
MRVKPLWTSLRSAIQWNSPFSISTALDNILAAEVGTSCNDAADLVCVGEVYGPDALGLFRAGI